MNRKKIYYTSGITAAALVMVIAGRMIYRPRFNAHAN